MNIRRILKEGQLFKLDRDTSHEKPHDKAGQAQTFERLQTEQTFENVQGRLNRQMNFQNMESSVAVVICGVLLCCLTTMVAAGFGYYLFADMVGPYIPYIPYLNQKSQMMYLSESNAQQYFENNQILAGQMHYARIPVEYWQKRIEMVKSMGLNSLSVYVFWNFHQIQKGKMDFSTGNKNLTYFLDIAKRNNMTVLLRPGPYVCAQWDFGGLPARLLSIKDMQIRSSNKLFIEQTKFYFKQLGQVIRKYVRNKQNPSGPILMIQIENQPGFFTKQKLYIQNLKTLWEQINLDCPFYFDDSYGHLQQNNLQWNNAILGVNFPLYEKQDFNRLGKKQHFGFAAEVYTGWFSRWGNNQKQAVHVKRYDQKFIDQFSSLLADKKSFSMYMAHGGTNFGLTAGYNMVTSYNYYAPINQVGNPTDKYHIFRSILMNFTSKTLPAIPEHIQIVNITMKQKTPISSIFDNLGNPLLFQNSTSSPLPFESNQLKMFNQGIVVYQTQISGPLNYTFIIIIHDLAIIYVNGIKHSTKVRPFDPQAKQQQQLNINCQQKQCKLQVLVQAMGHINFGIEMKKDKKGFIKFQSQSKQQKLTNNLKWKYYKFDLQNQLQWKNNTKCQKSPCLYFSELNIHEAKDTLLSLQNFKKGYVWINGHNLGRYWNIGPQQALYCPGVWLKNGKNKVLVLDIEV